jgi:hypothetical protein
VQFTSDLDEQFCTHGGCLDKRKEVVSFECGRVSSMQDIHIPMVK